MTYTIEEIGYQAHKEALGVFFGVGFFLGLAVTGFELAGLDPKDLVSLAQQAIALGIFFLLCFLGLFGILLTDHLGHTSRIRRTVHFLSLPMLRVGLTAGFAASGICMGLGLGGAFVFLFALDAERLISSVRLFFLGVSFSFTAWSLLYLFAELLRVTTKALQAIAVVFYVFVALILLVVAPWKYVGYLTVSVAGFGVIIWTKWRKTRKDAEQRVAGDA